MNANDTVTEQTAHEDLSLVEQAFAARNSADGKNWRERIKAAADRLDATLAFFVRNNDAESALRFATAMHPFWASSGEIQKGRDRLEQALTIAPTAATPVRAKALYHAGLIAFRQGDESASRAFTEQSLAIGRQLNDRDAVANALIGLSRLGLRNRDYALMRRHAGEALRIRQDMNDVTGEMTAVHMLAAAARMEGNTGEASKFYELTLAVHGKDGDKAGVAGELMNLAYVHLQRHDPAWAKRLFQESIAIYRELNSAPGLAWNIPGLAATAAEEGNGTLAARLYGAAQSEMKRLGLVFDPDDQLDYERYSSIARQQIGDAQFGREFAAGDRLSPDDALTLGLQPAP